MSISICGDMHLVIKICERGDSTPASASSHLFVDEQVLRFSRLRHAAGARCAYIPEYVCMCVRVCLLPCNCQFSLSSFLWRFFFFFYNFIFARSLRVCTHRTVAAARSPESMTTPLCLCFIHRKLCYVRVHDSVRR